MKRNKHSDKSLETAASIMSKAVPTCSPNDSFDAIINSLSTAKWDDIDYVFVLENQKLVGMVHVGHLIHHNAKTTANELMQPVKDTMHADDDQEKAVFLVVKNDLGIIPVVDNGGHFLGAITTKTIIDVMHREHIEDALLASGIRDAGNTSIVKLATERTFLIIRSRAPWLIGGLMVGLGLGLISSWFEASLEKTVALAYFIPVVAYIADSVGTQSEAIAVRALATLKLSVSRYMIKELFVGLVLGVMMGVIGGLGALIISRSPEVGLVVALSLFVASTVASVLAASIPLIFKRLGKDPALGSGPIATALQDVISIVIYFLFASLLIK